MALPHQLLLVFFLLVAVASATASVQPPTADSPVASAIQAAFASDFLTKLAQEVSNVGSPKAAEAPTGKAGPLDLQHKDLGDLLSYVKSKLSPASSPSTNLFNELTTVVTADQVAASPPAEPPSKDKSAAAANAGAFSAGVVFAAAFAGYFLS